MPYNIEDFKRIGLYLEKPESEEVELAEGHLIPMDALPKAVQKSLLNPGGSSHGGDYSQQDAAVITSMLTAGIKPSDVLKTFISSPRGKHAAERKPGHLRDYVERTIKKQVGFLNNGHVHSNGHKVIPLEIEEEVMGEGKISIDFSSARPQAKTVGLVTRRFSDVEVEEVKWLWPKYIPSGKITILAGDASMGKSTIVFDIISRITRGMVMPDGQRGVTGSCIIASAEDTVSDTILPRVLAAGAIQQKIISIDEVLDDEEGEARPISFPRDLSLIRQTLINSGARLMLIDPLDAFLGMDIDSHKNADIRRTLHPLEKVAEETGTSILILAHYRKAEGTNNLHRVGGSIGLTAAARSVLGVTLVDKRRILHPLKNNLVRRPSAMQYEVVSIRKEKSEKLTWKGGRDYIETSGIKWLGEVEYDSQSQTIAGANDPQTQAAVEFLTMVLSESGMQPSKKLISDARGIPIDKAHLAKAKDILNIGHRKVNDEWYWVWAEGQDRT